MFCSRLVVSAKSIIMMAFFFTISISKIMSIIVIIFSSLLVISNVSSALIFAVGSVERMVIG